MLIITAFGKGLSLCQIGQATGGSPHHNSEKKIFSAFTSRTKALHLVVLRNVYLNFETLHIGASTVAKTKTDASGAKVTQKEMVRLALEEKGWDAGPQELQVVIKTKFDYDMPVNYISNYKSQLKKESGKGGKSMKGPGRGRKLGGGPQFSDLETVRGLVDRLGADQVKKLVEMADMFV